HHRGGPQPPGSRALRGGAPGRSPGDRGQRERPGGPRAIALATAGGGPARGVDGPLLKQALLGSLSWLGANQEEVNRLNVFPVPDGDTGTNMLLTLQSAVED